MVPILTLVGKLLFLLATPIARLVKFSFFIQISEEINLNSSRLVFRTRRKEGRRNFPLCLSRRVNPFYLLSVSSLLSLKLKSSSREVAARTLKFNKKLNFAQFFKLRHLIKTPPAPGPGWRGVIYCKWQQRR